MSYPSKSYKGSNNVSARVTDELVNRAKLFCSLSSLVLVTRSSNKWVLQHTSVKNPVEPVAAPAAPPVVCAASPATSSGSALCVLQGPQ